MIDPKLMYPPKARYTLVFSNNTAIFTSEMPDFYLGCYEYLFEDLKDMLLSNSYLVMVNIMREYRSDWLHKQADTIYESSLSSVAADMDYTAHYDLDGITPLNILFDYLYQNEMMVKNIIYNIADRLVLTLFHPLHAFMITSQRLGVTYTDIDFAIGDYGQSILVTCTTNIEVIKKHDPCLYDRLSLLASV